MERVDRPARELGAEELDDRGEGLLRGEGPTRLGVDVGPVDDRADERELAGDERDVAERPECPLRAGGLQAEGDTEVAHLGLDPAEPFGDELVELLGGALADEAGVGDDGVRAERLPQLHRVLEGRQGRRPPLLVVDGEHGEIRRVDRHGEAAGGGRLAELAAPSLLPREALDERELHGCVVAFGERVEPGAIVDVFRRHPGDPEADHARIPAGLSGAVFDI